MIEAATREGVFFVHDGVGATPFYTQPALRAGEQAVFSLEVTHVGGSPTVVVKVEDRELNGTWSVAGTFANIDSIGVKTKNITGLKEEWRIALTFSAGSPGTFIHAFVRQSALPF